MKPGGRLEVYRAGGGNMLINGHIARPWLPGGGVGGDRPAPEARLTICTDTGLGPVIASGYADALTWATRSPRPARSRRRRSVRP